MAKEVIPMDVRLKIAVACPDIDVSEFCRANSISRQTFYVWRARYRTEGADGLVPRSRAPHHSPRRIPAELEDAIVELRKELDDLGVDSGPATIQWPLGRRGLAHAPSIATIWRILKRRGFVASQPEKRPKASFRR